MTFIKGHTPWNKGVKDFRKGYRHSKETKLRLKVSRPGSGRKSGFTLSEEIKRKISEGRKGITAKENHPNWKGGITPINKIIRRSFEYKLWRKSVFERDNYTCVWCFKRGVSLQADHIKPFALFPELRFAIDNGRTLCLDCHKKTDTYFNKSRWKNLR